jgi:ATP-dependent DNA helicase PIF1
MVDGDLFDKLEEIARRIRNNGRPFGGIQLVVTGDFFQLPPVPENGREAKFAFAAASWTTCIQHTVLLTNIFRQRDPEFADMLNEMRLGKITPRTIEAFRKLSRPLDFHDSLEATELYASLSRLNLC